MFLVISKSSPALKAPEKSFSSNDSQTVFYVQPALAGYYVLPNQVLDPGLSGLFFIELFKRELRLENSKFYNSSLFLTITQKSMF